ncbi:MAG: hypothetical protein Q7K71_03065 [Candidatus Omnitrophota bacterium]|nr:hypothetical protein [Candidatus Omnitrophota bacterium]
MYNRIIIFCGILLLMSGFASLAPGADRNVPIDQAVGGMEQGSRIQSPGSYSNKGVTSSNQGGTTGSITDRHTVFQESEKVTTADHQGKNISGGGNHGVLYQAGREQTNDPSTAGTPTVPSGQAGVETQEGNGGILVGGETSPTGQVETGEISTGIESPETAPEESSSDPSNPIVGVDAEVSPESGTVEADTAIDTSGELEERQILDADLTGETTGSVGAEVGSATDITAADLVEESDITTQLVTETIGQLDVGQTSGSGTTGMEESPGTSGDPIVDLDTNINPESGTTDASFDLDTRGELEDTQILELDLAAEDVTSIDTDLGSASGLTESETVGSLDVTTETVESLIPAPADLVAEIDTTGQTVGAEVDTGIAADVEGMSEGEDVVSDPADGLGL